MGYAVNTIASRYAIMSMLKKNSEATSSVIHFGAIVIFLNVLGTLAIAGFTVGFLLISIGNYIILRGKSAGSGMKALPLFHLAMLIYAITIILEYVM